MLLQICFVISSVMTACVAFPYFRDQIPNGYNVPNPCNSSTIWLGVGHQNPNGGGPRNPFGLAFYNANYTWTSDLCRQDSDGDGRANGVELGDPLCTWTAGSTPSSTDNITHPGVCDPYTTDFCKSKNTFLNCDSKGFDSCEVVKKPEVKQVNLTFPATKIPPTETNYYCMTFDLPSDQDYHIVANQPIINTMNIVHHMLLFGCKNRDDEYIPTPELCGMSAELKCGYIIGGWTVGQTGTCYGDKIGFRIGTTGYQRVKLQIHYNNPKLVDGYVDSSGIRLYYMPVPPGSQDLATFTTGQQLLIIPPGQTTVEHVGVCPSACSRRIITKPAYVISVLNHMHYLGRTMRVELFRGGAKLIDLSYDEKFSYDTPITHVHDPPFEMIAGDEIKTTCVYSSTSSNHYVYYGEATSDEMCYGFITAYPTDAFQFQSCVAFGSSSTCNLLNGDPIGQCNWKTFTNSTSNSKLFTDVKNNCNLGGSCRPECRDVLKSLQNNPCFEGEACEWVIRKLNQSSEGTDFLSRIRSCATLNITVCEQKCFPNCNKTDNNGNGSSNLVPAGFVSFLLTIIFLIFN